MKAGPTSPSSDNSDNRVSARAGMTPLPMEWLDARSWKLPSGQPLAEFAMRAGFLAPRLFVRQGACSAKPSTGRAIAPVPGRKKAKP